jgi:hypothetical protein
MRAESLLLPGSAEHQLGPLSFNSVQLNDLDTKRGKKGQALCLQNKVPVLLFLLTFVRRRRSGDRRS